MIKIYGKHKKRYVNHPRDQSKLTCIISGPGNSSDECKVLGDFGSKYTKIRPNKERSPELTLKKKVGIQQEKNTSIQHAVDEIILQ